MLPVILGISGPSLSSEERDLFTKHKPHGIILFKRNCHSREQIIALNRSIKDLIGADVKILIDQEGGRVARIKPPISSQEYPNMEFFGKIYTEEGRDTAIQKTEQNFFALMSELKELGIDVTCAPVCDLRHIGAHDIVGNRSFGTDTQIVIDLCEAALDGIHRAGGEGVLKHIPGHGRSMYDSHLTLPTVDTSLEELEKTDFMIFKALANKCQYAMTAHIIYSCFDHNNTITTSRNAIDYIRQNIGFTGMLMTDDLDMKALAGSLEENTEAALNAGCNIALQCSGNIKHIASVIDAIVKSVSSSSDFTI